MFFKKHTRSASVLPGVRPGIVFSRERCIVLAWLDDTDAIDRTVDVHVARLRRILGRDTVNTRTVPGVGYAIDLPEDE